MCKGVLLDLCLELVASGHVSARHACFQRWLTSFWSGHTYLFGDHAGERVAWQHVCPRICFCLCRNLSLCVWNPCVAGLPTQSCPQCCYDSALEAVVVAVARV